MIEVGRSEQMIIEMDKLASEDHTKKPLKKRLTFIVAIGGFTQMWHTSIRCQQGIIMISRRRCRQCTASSKRRTRRNMQHGHKIPPLLLGNGMQTGGSPILSIHLKDGMTLIARGNLYFGGWISICGKSLNVQKNLEFFIVNKSVTADGSLLSPTGSVKGMYPAPHIHEHLRYTKWLRQTAYILTHNLNMLEHIANNGMNTTTHTDANIAQF